MAKCETCGKEYHACGSCDIEDWQFYFCSDACRETKLRELIIAKADEYKIPIMTVEVIVDAVRTALHAW